MREMAGSLYVENTFLKSLTGGKREVEWRHLSSETWEAIVKAAEELKASLKPSLKELAVVEAQLLPKAKRIPDRKN